MSEDTPLIKFSWRFDRQFSRNIRQTVEKYPIS